MMRDWIHKYPGVQALLQQPDDVVPEPEEGASLPLGGRGLGLYLLDGHTPILVEDVLTWGRWFETTDRHVAWTQVGDVAVSTVFLGVDHTHWGHGPPILFESMAFGLVEGERVALDDCQERYATWEDAEQGHAAMVARVRADATP